MCVGVPMRVLSSGPGVALCEGRGRRERINCLLVGELPAGSWVLAFQGSALRVLDEAEAAATNDALDALERVMAGATDVGAHFADLLGREPQLPPHLREGGA